MCTRCDSSQPSQWTEPGNICMWNTETQTSASVFIFTQLVISVEHQEFTPISLMNRVLSQFLPFPEQQAVSLLPSPARRQRYHVMLSLPEFRHSVSGQCGFPLFQDPTLHNQGAQLALPHLMTFELCFREIVRTRHYQLYRCV